MNICSTFNFNYILEQLTSSVLVQYMPTRGKGNVQCGSHVYTYHSGEIICAVSHPTTVLVHVVNEPHNLVYIYCTWVYMNELHIVC